MNATFQVYLPPSPPSRKFKVFLYKQNGSEIQEEYSVAAPSMAECRRAILLELGVPSHRVYILDVT
jgi:hypothetical protein